MRNSEPKDTNVAKIRAKSILVVEDEENMVYLLRKALLRTKCGVFVASDGQQALDVYRRHKQDIGAVLLDIGLPKLSGWDTVLRMKEENK